jgi:KTSC domain
MLLHDESCNSSAIERAAYDSAEKVLFVFFKGDASAPRVWAYKGVPLNSFNALTQASSRGRYFHQHIRDQFPAERLFHGAVQSLLASLQKSGRAVQISWVEALAGTTAAEDSLGLFF